MLKRRDRFSIIITLLMLVVLIFAITMQAVLSAPAPAQPAKYVIVMIADGWGPQHIAAANAYNGTVPAYQSWSNYWTTTYARGGAYDPQLAWSDFDYVQNGATDSAAAATALFCGVKTNDGRIAVSHDNKRLYAITEKARALGKAVGAVTSVYASHATPGAWMAHNDARNNGYALADEGFWGDPNTTGTTIDSPYYNGGYGATNPPLNVIIGAGHPNWNGDHYINHAIRNKLAAENGQAGAFTFVERIAGNPDGGERLLDAANQLNVTRLAGLFGGGAGNLDYRFANGSGHNPENPTLAQMTTAALTVLNRDPQGFMLLVEGGAVDWAGHLNQMDWMLGEMLGFNTAVDMVIEWVEEPTNGSNWQNTLVIVTGDHETGYLTAGPGIFQDEPLGLVNANTLMLEKPVANSGRRASWQDGNGNNLIDVGETVYWAWNSDSHTNTLVPLYAKGVGADQFAAYAVGVDPVRGAYLDNTDVFKVLDTAVYEPTPTPTSTSTSTLTSTPSITSTSSVTPVATTTPAGNVTSTPALTPTRLPPIEKGQYLPIIQGGK